MTRTRYLATVIVDDKINHGSTCSSIVGRFDGHGGLPVQYEMHRPMQHVHSTPEATGSHHWETTCSILPQQQPGQQQTRLQQKNVPKRLGILMAAAVRWYNTTHITQ
jgi:hypothetical protein